MGACDPGLKHTRTLTVEDRHTAASVGSGDVAVLATPTVLTLAETACVEAIEGDVPEGQTSVGTWAEIEHTKATPVGQEICAEATLIGHHGRRLEFQVVIREDDEIVAKVRHRRILVDRDRFESKVGLQSTG